MPDLKISDDKRLDEMVLNLSPEQEVIDNETHQPIPGMIKRGFLFSCPYRLVEDGNIYPARPFARTIFDPGFRSRKSTPETKLHAAEQYTERYLTHVGHLDNQARLVFLNVKTALYDAPQEALDGSGQLNTFEVTGVIYKIGNKPT